MNSWGLLLALCLFHLQAVEAGVRSDDHQKVTCGSLVKLTHVSTGYKLHSHDVSYGSGSGQQSVTAFPNADDPNSLFLVAMGFGEKQCSRGDPLPCGATIRLQHSSTRAYLHSHLHESPLSNQQEVSGYRDPSNTDDNWKLECMDSAKFWMRDKDVQLVHKATGKYLSTSKELVFRNPIPGQLEVSASARSGYNTRWKTMEGIYFSDNPTFS